MHLHAFQIGICAVFLLIIVSMWKSREFLVSALSEPDAKGVDKPSHKRLVVFLFALTFIFCEIFHTLKQGKFDFQHVIAILVTMLLYSGIATVAQVMTIWKGNSSTVTVKQETTQTAQVQTT